MLSATEFERVAARLELLRRLAFNSPRSSHALDRLTFACQFARFIRDDRGPAGVEFFDRVDALSQAAGLKPWWLSDPEEDLALMPDVPADVGGPRPPSWPPPAPPVPAGDRWPPEHDARR